MEIPGCRRGELLSIYGLAEGPRGSEVRYTVRFLRLSVCDSAARWGEREEFLDFLSWFLQ